LFLPFKLEESEAITIEDLDVTETIQNRLEYEIQAGKVKTTDPLLKYI
jgi:hypothetical protein